MKKQMLKSALIALAGVGLMSGVALADPTFQDIIAQQNSLGNNYVLNGADYWSPTDLTTTVNGNSQFEIKFEYASYLSDFGIYTQSGSLFQIFAGTNNVGAEKTVTYKTVSGVSYVSLDATNWTVFDSVFGFYFKVLNTGKTYYTDATKNSDTPTEHVLTAYDSATAKIIIGLEDLEGPYGNGEPDFNDMVVKGNDLAPVPEPTTMLLFGTGIAGLAGIARRRKSN